MTAYKRSVLILLCASLVGVCQGQVTVKNAIFDICSQSCSGSPTTLKSLTLDNMVTCAIFCRHPEEPGCQAFSYDTQTSQCHLLSAAGPGGGASSLLFHITSSS